MPRTPPNRHRNACVLLTGFDPFGGETINPSWEAVRALQGKHIAGRRVVARQLPTSFSQAPALLLDALHSVEPDLVICVGQAGGRTKISLERIAINVCDARIPDNDGAQPREVPAIPRGPDGLFSTLPLHACLAAMQAASIPAEISNNAGTYVCNQVMYVLLHELRRHPQSRGGFLHIPFIPEQALYHRDAPSMALDKVIEALRCIVRVTLDPRCTPGLPVASSGREH